MNLDVCGVSFGYGRDPVVSDVSFTISSGEVVGMIGPNGGGKTTLLKLMIGLLVPDSGSIERKFRRMGYVPQAERADLSFPLSCEEVVLMGDLSRLGFFGGFSPQDRERARALLDQLGLGAMIRRPLSALSGGERQRVFFARAWMSDPDILFLDEPTASCDMASQQVIYNQISAVKGKKTILMVTHDLTQALQYFDRVICVDQGVSVIEASHLCEHFALGLYHTPLANSACFRKKKKGKP